MRFQTDKLNEKNILMHSKACSSTHTMYAYLYALYAHLSNHNSKLFSVIQCAY
uniref:Uncharacterized protein n=1 Tax=Arundo donax TaxID=35708 RepID=A0A0A9HJR6_ARUDO